MKYVMVALVVLIAAVVLIVGGSSEPDVRDEATALYEEWAAVNGPHEGSRLTITRDRVELSDGGRTLEGGPLRGVFFVDEGSSPGARTYLLHYGHTEPVGSLTVVLGDDGTLRLANHPHSRWLPRDRVEP